MEGREPPASANSGERAGQERARETTHFEMAP